MRPCAPAVKILPSAPASREDYVLYAILDFVVDNYLPVIEAMESEVAELEDRVL